MSERGERERNRQTDRQKGGGEREVSVLSIVGKVTRKAELICKKKQKQARQTQDSIFIICNCFLAENVGSLFAFFGVGRT